MTDPGTLYYLAERPREAVREARAWLLDCFGGEPKAVKEITVMNAVSVVAAVEQHYEGGWRAFLIADDNLKGMAEIPFTETPPMPKTAWKGPLDFAEVAEALGVNTVDVMALLPDRVVLFTPRPNDDDPEIHAATLGRDADGILVAGAPRFISVTSDWEREIEAQIRAAMGDDA